MIPKSQIFIRSAVTAFLSLGVTAFLFAAAPVRAYSVIIPSDTAQTLDGFGVSVTWSGGEIMRLPAAEKERVLRLFFTEAGAGISIIRMRLVAKTDEDFA